MQRIHFTSDDVARVRLATRADPMWETLLSMHLLQQSRDHLLFGTWRHLVRRRLRRSTDVFGMLAPPQGYSADFLTPTTGHCDFDSGLDTVLSTPRRRLSADVTRLAQQGRLPGYARHLADGNKEVLGLLENDLRAHHAAAVAPYWGIVQDRTATEAIRQHGLLVRQGVEALLGNLHPRIQWSSPVLTIHYLSASVPDRDVYLDGRGLTVVPSFFCRPGPLTLRDPDLPPVLVVPLDHHDPQWTTTTSRRQDQSLGALLGVTRARILGAIADGGCSTSQLAHRTGVSIATASHHAAVLRDSGLIITTRHGSAVLHSVTHLGLDLLN